MPTIAELQIKLDSSQVKQGTQELNEFATAADRASKSSKANSQANNDASTSAGKAAKSESDLSSMIDAQTRKLEQLATQRNKLNSSNMKSTLPTEYERLNRIIDANIALVMRQGNAVDTLNAKQDRDSSKREKAAATELRIQERINEAAIRQENVITRAAAKQQQQIESTINGLSRQVKAQNEYNRTIETLNKARVTTGMGSSGGGISGAEYETWVKLAKARRDAALASEDNSRAVQSAQSKLESYTATLGKIERAEVAYARAVRVLDENLNNGKLTMDQYTTQVERFANQRNKAIAAANDNSKAEQRFARDLQAVVTAYDPVLRAQESYNNSVKILRQGLESGSISVDKFNKAMDQQKQALEGVKNAQSGKQDLGAQYDAALNSLVPYRAELRNLEAQEKVLRAQKEAGKVTTKSQISDYDKATDSINRQREALLKRINAGNNAGLSYKQEQAALRGIPAQITDIVVSLQGGQAPLTVLLQQGGQLKDMFGGVVPAVKALAGSLVALINPLTVVGTAIAIAAVGAYQGSEEITNFNKALIQTGGVSGVTSAQFSIFREELDRTTTTSGKAAEALTLIEKSGRVAGDIFVQVAESAILFQKATGQSIKDTVDDFASLGKDPVEAAVRLDEKYRFLTASVLSQADALVKQGKEVEAVKLLQTQLSETASDTSKRMIEEAGYVEQAWLGIKKAVSETWDEIKNIGRGSEDGTGDRLTELYRQRKNISDQVDLNDKILGGFGASSSKKRLADIDKEILQLKQRIDVEKLGAESQAKSERVRQESVSAQLSAQKRLVSGLKGVEKAEYELGQVRKENDKIRAGAANGVLTPEQSALIAKNEAAALKEVAEAKEKANKPGRSPALNTRDVQEVKSNLNVLTAEYEGYYKRVTALGEANIVSEQATYYSQKAILEEQRKAVSTSYDDQIKSIKSLQGNKKNSAAQNISLDNQLTKAESDRVIALEKIDTKLDTLQAKEKGRIDKRTASISAYKEALDAQLESLREEGQRAVDGAGKGDREAAVAKQLAENDRTFDKQQRSLAKSLGEGMDPVEYAQKLRDLKDAHTEMSQQILKNNDEINASNADWTNGFTKAIANAQDEANNFAKATEQAVTGAFNSMADALATFVTTGKLDFRSLTISIISDIAKIAAKQAALGALSSIFGAFGGGFGGAASAGTTSGISGFSDYGQITTVQKDGGAWNGGTQFFANGGAFTNSIVSSPTAFNMSGGKTGVMGEAGPEAIVPLARTSDGSLGVRMIGGNSPAGGNSGVIVYVTITGEGATTSTNENAASGFGKEIGEFVESKYRELQSRDLSAGGSLNRAITER